MHLANSRSCKEHNERAHVNSHGCLNLHKEHCITFTDISQGPFQSAQTILDIPPYNVTQNVKRIWYDEKRKRLHTQKRGVF